MSLLPDVKMNHVRGSSGTAIQIRTSGSQSDPTSIGKKPTILVVLFGPDEVHENPAPVRALQGPSHQHAPICNQQTLGSTLRAADSGSSLVLARLVKKGNKIGLTF